MIFKWNETKDKTLKETRNISFKDVVKAVDDERILDIYAHPNKDRYPDQFEMIVEINSYAYLVPFIKEDDNTIFFKTVIPSRKMTKNYLGK